MLTCYFAADRGPCVSDVTEYLSGGRCTNEHLTWSDKHQSWDDEFIVCLCRPRPGRVGYPQRQALTTARISATAL